MNLIQMPQGWDDRGLITFEEFLDLIRTRPPAVRDRRQCHVGPRWMWFDGCGRLYITVAMVRQFLRSTTLARREVRTDG